MKKRILSVVSAMFVICSMFCTSLLGVHAQGETGRQVDGSYLTMEESSTAELECNPLLRGQHLMDGTVTISKAGVKRIFVYGSTTADHVVDYLAVIVYVDEYNAEEDRWEQIDFWTESAENDYYVVTQRAVSVDGGHYYRARCEHFAGNEGEMLFDTSGTVTDGIWVD